MLAIATPLVNHFDIHAPLSRLGRSCTYAGLKRQRIWIKIVSQRPSLLQSAFTKLFVTCQWMSRGQVVPAGSPCYICLWKTVNKLGHCYLCQIACENSLDSPIESIAVVGIKVHR